MGNWTVGIVGGGPGGLMTAYFLEKLATEPFTTTLFEASPRLGGKVLTRRFALAPASYEAGAAELYDYSVVGEDALRELITELGLPISHMRGGTVVMNHRVLAHLDDVRDHLGPQAAESLATFDRWARDRISPREFYHSDDPAPDLPGVRFDAVLTDIPDPNTRRYVETLIHSDLATEPENTSIAYGLHNYLMNDPQYMGLYSIVGGNERLVLELAARVRATTLTEHLVVRIGRDVGEKLTITSSHHGQARRDEFDFVVLALPNGYLPAITFDCGQLADAMRRHHAHYDHPAHYLRVTILFDHPFWRGAFQDSFYMLDQFGGCCLYDESSRDPGAPHAVLGWLLGGEAARKMSELGDQALIDAVLDSLPDFLRHGRSLFREGHVHRWVGAVSSLPGGIVLHSLDRRHQPEPVEHPNLFVVGDYLFDSTLNGVLDSAEYVAGWIAARMTDSLGGRA